MWGNKKDKSDSNHTQPQELKAVTPKAKAKAKDQQPTLISGNATVRGDIDFCGQLFIHGSVVGDIKATEHENGALTVSDQGNIQGDVHAPVIIINGTVVGDIYASQQIQLENQARITGNIYYHVIEMAKGARVNGSLVQQDADMVKAAEKNTAVKKSTSNPIEPSAVSNLATPNKPVATPQEAASATSSTSAKGAFGSVGKSS